MMVHPLPQVITEELQSSIRQERQTNTEVPLEENYLDEIQLEHLKTLKEGNATLAQNNKERKKYAGWIFKLTCIWGCLIFVIVFLHGFRRMFLSDNVLITLITSTTINFFGFFLLVVKYLFNTGAEKTKLVTV